MQKYLIFVDSYILHCHYFINLNSLNFKDAFFDHLHNVLRYNLLLPILVMTYHLIYVYVLNWYYVLKRILNACIFVLYTKSLVVFVLRFHLICFVNVLSLPSAKNIFSDVLHDHKW